ncbi:MAG: metal-dependent hydrolase [Candidatus Korarchaeota archaeon NZ13-K]|nr:MAG: metal-dependent hydrolase [Candidatus Korarchaeota archaeon NZ13-K]
MLRVTFLGHSAFLLEGSKRVLIDPWIDGNPQAPMKIEECRGADVYIVTHDHGDHGLSDAIRLSKRHGGIIVSIYEIAEKARREGASSLGANIGGFFEVNGMRVALTNAVHSSGVGAPVGAVVELDDRRIYHAGDTGVFYDMKIIGELYKPDLALLPIGGHYVMGPLEASLAVELLGVQKVIPMHYGTFPVLRGNPEEFKRFLESRGLKAEVIVLRPGESYEL